MAQDSLIPFLTKTRTAQMCDILYKNSGEKASSYSDLAYKIANMYDNAVDKEEIEKQLASIHPHRSFILRNLSAKPTENAENKESALAQEIIEVVKEPVSNLVENKSNCEGNPNCGCNHNKSYSNACGCGSHFDGENTKEKTVIEKITPYLGLAMTMTMTIAIVLIALQSGNRKNYML